MTLSFSNRGLDSSSILPNDAQVTSTAAPNDPLKPSSSTYPITSSTQNMYGVAHNNLRENYLRNQETDRIAASNFSLTSSPAIQKQIQQDTLTLQNALQFDLEKFLKLQKAAGVSELEALGKAKEQIVVRVGLIASYNTGLINKDQVLALLSGNTQGVVDDATKQLVMKRISFYANPELSPSLNTDQYRDAGIGMITAQSANNDPKVFKAMLQNYLNTTFRTHLEGIQGSANYFQEGSPWDQGLSGFFRIVSWTQGAGPVGPRTSSQQAVSSGNIATDIITQAAAISEATAGIDSAKKTLLTKYGINEIADAEGWKRLAGGRPIVYSEELYNALFKDSATGGKAIPKDKDEIKSLLAGNTLDPKLKPMVEAYAKLQNDPAQAQTLAKLNDALSLSYTINHLTKEINEAKPNFEQRFARFKTDFSSPEKMQSLDTEESSKIAIPQLSAQLVRDMVPGNPSPKVVPSSEHQAIKAFAKELGIEGFDQDMSSLSPEKIADLTKKAEIVVRAAEYVRLKNKPGSNSGSISPEQLEQLKRAVGIDPAKLDQVAAKYQNEQAILHLGDLCSPAVFALEAGAALQKK